MQIKTTTSYLVLSVLVAANCAAHTSKFQIPAARGTKSANLINAKLRRNKNLWSKRNFKNYRYSVEARCFCTAMTSKPITIQVRNGVTKSMTATAPEDFTKFGTIDKIFQVVQRALNDKYEIVQVTYNATSGYPTKISLDSSTQMTDDELELIISNFKTIR